MFSQLFKKSEATPTASAPTSEPPAPSRPVVTPAVDLIETDQAVILTADMPGVDQAGVELQIERGTLTIRGRNRQLAPKDFHQIYREAEPCDYERTFTLSQIIDQGAISATMKQGVLRVELPKQRAAQPRRIAVTAA